MNVTGPWFHGDMGERELAAVAADQLGLVTRRQARDHLTRKALESRLSTKRLETERRGVYRFPGTPPTRWQTLLAACLAAGPGAVASHRSAAELWSMPDVIAERLELTVPAPMWLRLPGVQGHQSTVLPAAHCASRHGVPVTTPARTLADLSTTSIGVRLLARLVDDCLRRRLLMIDNLVEAYDMLHVPGRRALPRLKAVLDHRRAGYRPGDSEPERQVLGWLVDAGLPTPVQQHQVVAGHTVYLLDLAYPQWRIGIEYDGWEWHGTRWAQDHDARRGNTLAAHGWTVLHATSATTATELVDAVRAVRERPLVEV